MWHSAKVTPSINDTQHNNDLPLCWLSLCWVSGFIYYYAECHYAECCNAECHFAEWRSSLQRTGLSDYKIAFLHFSEFIFFEHSELPYLSKYLMMSFSVLGFLITIPLIMVIISYGKNRDQLLNDATLQILW